MEAAKGCNKDITARTQVICDRCDGKRAEPGTTYSTCSTCKGTGEVLIFFFYGQTYCVDTQTRSLGRRLPDHNIF